MVLSLGKSLPSNPMLVTAIESPPSLLSHTERRRPLKKTTGGGVENRFPNPLLYSALLLPPKADFAQLTTKIVFGRLIPKSHPQSPSGEYTAKKYNYYGLFIAQFPYFTNVEGHNNV